MTTYSSIFGDAALSTAAAVAGNSNATSEERAAAALVALEVLDRLGGRRAALEALRGRVSPSESIARLNEVDGVISRAEGIVRALAGA